ncbi:hypothetical protein PDN49_08430 [Bacillus cereus]|nr:hypothetical protein [Bacillus cereus]
MDKKQPKYVVSNSRNFETKERSKIRSVFIFYVPYLIHLNPGEEFEVCLPENKNKKHTIKVINKTPYTLKHNQKFFGFNDTKEEDLEKNVFVSTGDRFGITGYSEMEIKLDRYIDLFDKNEKIDPGKLYKAVEKMCLVYNYFLDVYGAITKHRQVLKISPVDIHTLQFHQLNESNEIFNQVDFKHLFEVALFKGFVSPSDQEKNRMKKILMSADENVRYASLGVNAVRSVYAGEYLSGIVQAVTQLERFLYILFENRMEDIEKTERKKIMTTLGLSNLLILLKMVLSGKEFTSIEKAVDLDKIKQAITARNNYIHEGDDKVGTNSFAKAQEFVNEINLLCVALAKVLGIDHILDREELDIRGKL